MSDPRSSPVLIAPLGPSVAVAVTVGDMIATAYLTLDEAERAAGQIAVAILVARLAARGGDWLDRRDTQQPA